MFSYSTDWLGSIPVFYNECTKKISYNVRDVIDYSNIKFHPEGLKNYLQFGYSVYGQTMIQGVKFLKPNETIELSDGELVIEKNEDLMEKQLNKSTSKTDTIELIHETIEKWAIRQDEIILPLSGGYDSRFLGSCLRNNSKVKCYTYGVSEQQNDSAEVVYAEALAQQCGFVWKQVPLNSFWNYSLDWYKRYGISVHLHGMYGMEFYSKIACENPNRKGSVLSGIIGDAWAGNVHINEIRKIEDISELGYSHGISVPAQVSKLHADTECRDKYFEANREKFEDERWRIVEAMRFKMILLSYLCEIPKMYGFNSWSPFLEMNIAVSMLNLPTEERKNRKWQQDYFEKINLGKKVLKRENIDYSNVLNISSLRRQRLEPLQVDILSEVIDESYIEYINRTLERKPLKYLPWYGKSIGSIINPIIHGYNRTISKALNGYMVIKPIEYLLREREGEVL